MTARPDHPDTFQPTMTAAGALVLAVAGFAGLALWIAAGEAVYVERLFAAIATCF